MNTQQKTAAARALAASQAQQARVKRENAAAHDMLEVLTALDARMEVAIRIGATAAEAYDSYYQRLVRDTIKQATGG